MGRNSVHKIKRAPRYSAGSSVVHLEDESDLIALLEGTENPLLLLLEGVQDPHNLGACLRTASGCRRNGGHHPDQRRLRVDPQRSGALRRRRRSSFLQVKNTNMLLRKLSDLGILVVGNSGSWKRITLSSRPLPAHLPRPWQRRLGFT